MMLADASMQTQRALKIAVMVVVGWGSFFIVAASIIRISTVHLFTLYRQRSGRAHAHAAIMPIELRLSLETEWKWQFLKRIIINEQRKKAARATKQQ